MAVRTIGKWATVFVLAFAACGTGSAVGQTPFYQGKSVTLLTHTGPGTSGDTYSRSLARYMPKYVEGAPSLIVQYMGGGGGKRISNHVYRIAASDGTVFAGLNQALGLDQIFSTDVDYNAAKFTWIGRITPTTGLVMVYHTAPARTLDDMKSTEIIFGANGKASQTYMTPMLMRNLLGMKTKVILGYPTSAEIYLAMARGEVQARTGAIETVLATNPDWIEKGTIRILGELSLEKEPSIPGVPLLAELAPDAASRETLELVASYTVIGISYAAPPNVPQDRAQILRRAFDSVMADPGFLEEMQRSKLEVRPETGERLQQLTKQFENVTPELIQRARAALEF